jgi:hypothetical protein
MIRHCMLRFMKHYPLYNIQEYQLTEPITHKKPSLFLSIFKNSIFKKNF